MSTPGAWNFTVAETGIVARLKTATQAGPSAWCRAVGTRADLAVVAEEMQVTPALYVVYDGFAVLAADEYSATLAHRWFVVLAVASAVTQRESAPRNQEAGPFMGDALAALHGYTPPDCKSALVPVTPPRPYYSGPKFAYFPLAFTTESYHCTTPTR